MEKTSPERHNVVSLTSIWLACVLSMYMCAVVLIDLADHRDPLFGCQLLENSGHFTINQCVTHAPMLHKSLANTKTISQRRLWH